METILVALLVIVLLVLVALIGVVIWLGTRVSAKPVPQNNEQIANLAGKPDAIQKQVDSSLQSVTNQVSVFGEVKETLGKVTEATSRVAQLGEDFPGETFRVLKEKEVKQFGDASRRTRRLASAASGGVGQNTT